MKIILAICPIWSMLVFKMKREDWKVSYRNQRVAARKAKASAHRVLRKCIHSLATERYDKQMTFLEQIHIEIAPTLAKLNKSQEALDNLGLT